MKHLITYLITYLSIQWIYVINQDVNLRKGLDNKKRVLTTVPKGETITVLEKTNEWWWHVEYKGTKGYIAVTFIDISYPRSALALIQRYPYPTIAVVLTLFLILLFSRKGKKKRTKRKPK